MALRVKQTVNIPYLTGLDESYGNTNGNTSSSPMSWNVRTDNGRISLANGVSPYISDGIDGDAQALYCFIDREDGEDIPFVIVGTPTKLYAHNMSFGSYDWQEIYSGANSGDWGFITYQNASEVLLLASNGVDPLLYWDGVSESAQEVTGAPCKGRHLAIHFERVFCAGDPDYPDRVYYSRAYAPFDWTSDIDHPESGGGFVDIPTWDGGKITGLFSDGQDIVVTKNTTMFRLYGTTPADFTIVPVSGSMGVVAPNGHALSGVTHYFVTENGIATYYGGAFALMDDRRLPMIFDPHWRELYDTKAPDLHLFDVTTAAAVAEGQQRVLFSLACADDNIILEYDVARQTFNLRRGIYAIAFARTPAPYALTLFLTKLGNQCYVYMYDAEHWFFEYYDALGQGQPQDAFWATPWMDLGVKYARKRVSSVRMFGTISDPTGDPSHGAVMLGIETDKASKHRLVTSERMKTGSIRIATNVPGERFRFTLQNDLGSYFAFDGGLEIEVELDE